MWQTVDNFDAYKMYFYEHKIGWHLVCEDGAVPCIIVVFG